NRMFSVPAPSLQVATWRVPLVYQLDLSSIDNVRLRIDLLAWGIARWRPGKPAPGPAQRRLPSQLAYVRSGVGKGCRTKRCSEREPADSLGDKSNVIGGWLPSLTFTFDNLPTPWQSNSRVTKLSTITLPSLAGRMTTAVSTSGRIGIGTLGQSRVWF